MTAGRCLLLSCSPKVSLLLPAKTGQFFYNRSVVDGCNVLNGSSESKLPKPLCQGHPCLRCGTDVGYLPYGFAARLLVSENHEL